MTQFILPGCVGSWEGSEELENQGAALYGEHFPYREAGTPLLDGEERPCGRGT